MLKFQSVGSLTEGLQRVKNTPGGIYFGAANMVDRKGKVVYQYDRTKENNPYQTEHDELFAAIAKREYKFDDTENGAKSTMTAILGRMATYSGNVLEFEKTLNSGLSIMPTQFDFNAMPPIVPNADGLYPVAVPGVTNYNA